MHPLLKPEFGLLIWTLVAFLVVGTFINLKRLPYGRLITRQEALFLAYLGWMVVTRVLTEFQGGQASVDVVLSVEDGHVMVSVHDTPGLDQNSLAERMALDRTTISTLVFRLEQQGLIERSVNGADRRARVLRLTPEGAALHDRIRVKTQEAQESTPPWWRLTAS